MTWRTTIRLAAVFTVFVLVWAIWRPSVGEPVRPQMLFPWTSDKYAKVEIQPAGKPEIILEQRRIGKVSWYVTKPISRPAWTPYVEDMIGGLRELRSDCVVEPGKPDHNLAVAGLEKPALVVRLDASGARKTVKFGKLRVKDPTQRWFVVEGDPNLYFGPTAAYDALIKSVGEMRHRGVMFFEPSRVAKIEIQERYERPGIDPKGQNVVLTGYDTSVFEVRSDADRRVWWSWVKDNDRDVEESLDGDRIRQFLGGLDNLMADDFAEVGEPEKYGLDRPETKVRLWVTDQAKPVGILFGKSEKTGERMVTYLQEEGSSEVAVVDRQRLKTLPLKRNAFRSAVVMNVPGAEVRSVEIATDLGRIRIAPQVKNGRTVWTLQEPAGLPSREEDLVVFVTWLFSMRVKDFLGHQPDLKTFGLDPPGVTATVKLRGAEGKEQSLEYRFGRKGSGDTYLMKPGTDEVFAAPAAVYQGLDLLDLNFRSLTVFEVPRDSVIEIYATLEDEQDPAKKPATFWIVKKADGTWTFRDSANVGEVDPDKLRDVLMVSNYIAAESFISRRPEVRKECGLEGNSSAGKLEIAYEDKDKMRRQFVLKISRPLVRGGEEMARYGMMEGDSTIFRLPKDLAKTLKAGVLKEPR